MSTYNLSLLCAAFNFGILLLSAIAIALNVHFISSILFIGFTLTPIITFTGVLLGIGALVLKEAFLKCLYAIALNLSFFLLLLFILANF